MNSKFRGEQMDELFKAVLTLKTVDECYAFFGDMCTVLELQNFAQRIQVAKMLMSKNVYSDIVATTGASTATISRVNRTLTQDDNGGYALVFKRLKEQEEAEKNKNGNK